MPNAKDLTVDFRLFAMFVGTYDSGKTTAAASFPGQKYVMDFDGRIMSLRGRADVDFDFYKCSKEGFKEADTKIETLIAYQKTNNMKYNMVVFDSLSTARRFLLADAMKITGVGGGRKIGNLQLATVQDYGYEAEAMTQLIWDGLKQLNCNVVVTGHTVDEFKKFQDSPGAPVERIKVGEKIYGDPQLLAVLPVAFTEVYRFFKEVDATGTVRRFVEFDSDVARTTYPALAKQKRLEITDKNFYEEWKRLIGGS